LLLPNLFYKSLLLLTVSISSGVCNAEKLTVALGETTAPWVLAETRQGIIPDILTATLQPLGYELTFLYVPYARRISAYQNGTVDIASDMNANTIEQHQLDGYFSDISYSYENYAFSLSKRQFHFTEINQLKHHSLLSWQDAKVHLGKEYASMANSNPQYTETFDQSVQVRMLFLGRVEVIQMDEQIFAYYRAKLSNDLSLDMSQAVDRFALFGPSPNGFLFSNAMLRDEFNAALRKLKASGDYDKIINQYRTGHIPTP
jgi:polar amino acid transport system substrate-binding protein